MMYVGAFRDPSSTGGADFVVQTTGTTALGPSSRWHDLGWRTPYVVTDEDVLFLTSVNGEDRLAVYHYRSDTVVTLAPATSYETPLVAGVLDGQLRVLGGGIALGDEDGDGILDVFDVCPHVPDPKQVDVDHDGLGEASGADQGCDPTLCSDLVPARSLPVRASLRNPALVTDRALRYLEARVEADRQCLAGRDAGSADLDALCLGSFVADAENPPLRGPTPEEVHAELALAGVLGALPRKEQRSATHVARQVIRAYGEAANAIARVTATSTDDEVATLLRRARTMQECAVLKIATRSSPTEACFGALVAGVPPSPWAATPADCVTWRRTVFAATTLLGEVE
jgi:hypothetical protein